MSEKSQHKNIILATMAFTAVVAVVGLIGFLTLGNKQEVLQGQVEVNEYRVASKVLSLFRLICRAEVLT